MSSSVEMGRCPGCQMSLPPGASTCLRCGVSVSAGMRGRQRAFVMVGLAAAAVVAIFVAQAWRLNQAAEPPPVTEAPSAPDQPSPAETAKEKGPSPLAESVDEVGERDPVERWIEELERGEGSTYQAAQALGESGDPRAAAALLDALRAGEYQRVSGAAAFFVALDDPALEPLLVELLRESRDLAVAQAYVTSGNERLAVAGREWAEGVGFVWDGGSWQSAQ